MLLYVLPITGKLQGGWFKNIQLGTNFETSP